MTRTPENRTANALDQLGWTFRRTFAEHYGAARDALAMVRRPDADDHHDDLLAWVTAHALMAIAAALDPDTAASVQRGEPPQNRLNT